jgi:hypothetical protein
MPIRNELFGAYKILTINDAHAVPAGNTTVLAETYTQNTTMETKPKTLIQGTVQTRILDIGALSEEFTIKAPILIGGGSTIDGRTLMNSKIYDAMQSNITYENLPIITKATVEANADKGCSVSLNLKSDADPLNSGKYVIADSGGTPPSELDDPTDPTRVARNYDLAVKIGRIKYLVQNCKLEVDIEVSDNVFLAGGVSTGSSQTSDLETLAKANWQTQYPWLGVSSIIVKGSGTAAVEIASINDPQVTGQNVTRQTSGNVVVEDTGGDTFDIQVYDGVSDYDSLFIDPIGGTDPLFDISKSVIYETDFSVSKDLITVDFSFYCYVFDYAA